MICQPHGICVLTEETWWNTDVGHKAVTETLLKCVV